MSYPGRTPPIGLLVAISLVGPLGTHLVMPALPGLQQAFATDYSTAQLLVSLFMVAFGGMQILVGPLADAWGRRRVLLGGLTIFCVTSVLCAVAVSIEMLIAARIVQGAAGCVGLVLARAIVRDLFQGGQTARMLGYLSMGMSMGPMLAPALGGLFYENFGWASMFWFLAAVSGASLALGWLFVPETSAAAATRFRFGVLLVDFRALLSHRDFLLYGACICFNTGVFYSFVIGSPYVGTRLLGMTPASYGLWFFMAAAGFALGNLASSRLAGGRDPRRIMLAGTASSCVGVLAMAGIFAAGHGAPATMFATMAAITFSSGFIMPNALAGVLAAVPDKAGSASGLIGFLQFAFAAIFSYAVGAAIEGSPTAMPMLATMFAAALASMASAGLLFAGPSGADRRG